MSQKTIDFLVAIWPLFALALAYYLWALRSQQKGRLLYKEQLAGSAPMNERMAAANDQSLAELREMKQILRDKT